MNEIDDSIEGLRKLCEFMEEHNLLRLQAGDVMIVRVRSPVKHNETKSSQDATPEAPFAVEVGGTRIAVDPDLLSSVR